MHKVLNFVGASQVDFVGWLEVVAWWDAEACEGAWVREGEGVEELARKLGTGYDEGVDGGDAGPLRTNVRTTVQGLKIAFTPSEYWRVPPP
ncbi:hypothetical protein C8J57DRAFT_1518324 [Mycena rebaudengoi]|nr:hypothetical protein C8J57DRAFT_1518324 [Mycena rebaudengoi]